MKKQPLPPTPDELQQQVAEFNEVFPQPPTEKEVFDNWLKEKDPVLLHKLNHPLFWAIPKPTIYVMPNHPVVNDLRRIMQLCKAYPGLGGVIAWE